VPAVTWAVRSTLCPWMTVLYPCRVGHGTLCRMAGCSLGRRDMFKSVWLQEERVFTHGRHRNSERIATYPCRNLNRLVGT